MFINNANLQGKIYWIKSYEKGNTFSTQLIIEIHRGTQSNKTDKISVSFWGDLAKEVNSKFVIGDWINVVGEIRDDHWKDDYGNWRSKIYVNAKRYSVVSEKDIEEEIPF